MPASLTIDRLCVTAGGQTLLQDARLDLLPGEINLIVGASGAGKSILLRLIAGLLPRSGEAIQWSGELTWHRDLESPTPPRCGIVFQQFALFDELTAPANVQFAIDHRDDGTSPAPHTAVQWLDFLGVPKNTPVAALSGGQKQRLAIARTLAAQPDIILYDEPTSGLDAGTGKRVANLIRETQTRFARTSVVVTHDYATLLPIADRVFLFDSHAKSIRSIEPSDWLTIPEQLGSIRAESKLADSPSRVSSSAGGRFAWLERWCSATGDVLMTVARLPIEARPTVPHGGWALRFLGHYLRLIGGPSACVYLGIAGIIAGFTTTYFTLRFLPFRLYTQPLLIDELLASIGFALYRILVPVLATILIAARCGAAIAADVAVKQYGGQVDAIRTLGVRSSAYLLVPILAAFLIATPILEAFAFTASHWISRITFVKTHPEIGVYFWQQHFFRAIQTGQAMPFFLSGLLYKGWAWVLAKNLLCGGGTAAIGYYQGVAPKGSASDVSAAITATVLWATLWVLVVHFLVALAEF